MMDALQLGASLYVPATRPDLLPIGNRVKYPHLRSVIFCTEDATHAADLPQALASLKEALPRFEPSPLLRFVRVRNPAVLRRVLRMEGVRQLAGFVFPKVTRQNLDEYFAAFAPDDPYRVMLILETAEVFDPAQMASLRARLLQEPDRRRILSLRVGGNDLLQLLGLRRPRGRSIYATPLLPVLGQLVTMFRPHGFNVTAPVFEWLNCDRQLAREARRDVEFGLFGKGAIHPNQVPVIEAAYQVSARDLHAAEQILAADAPSVFRLHDGMCEPATHRAWATIIRERARLYGVRNGSSRSSRAARLSIGNG